MKTIKAIGGNVPSDLLDGFELKGGEVYWASAAPIGSKKTHDHWCKLAGSLPVFGRGRVVNYKGYRLLSSDVAFALSHAGDWPWQFSADTPTGDSGQDNPEFWIRLARQRWRMDGDQLVWAMTRGDGAEEGKPVKGQAMSGHRCAVISTSGMGFLKDDVIKLLTTEK